jgi:hypothetical protein
MFPCCNSGVWQTNEILSQFTDYNQDSFHKIDNRKFILSSKYTTTYIEIYFGLYKRTKTINKRQFKYSILSPDMEWYNILYNWLP